MSLTQWAPQESLFPPSQRGWKHVNIKKNKTNKQKTAIGWGNSPRFNLEQRFKRLRVIYFRVGELKAGGNQEDTPIPLVSLTAHSPPSHVRINRWFLTQFDPVPAHHRITVPHPAALPIFCVLLGSTPCPPASRTPLALAELLLCTLPLCKYLRASLHLQPLTTHLRSSPHSKKKELSKLHSPYSPSLINNLNDWCNISKHLIFLLL